MYFSQIAPSSTSTVLTQAVIFAGNNDNHKSSDVLTFSHTPPLATELHVELSLNVLKSFFLFFLENTDSIPFKLADKEEIRNILDKLEFWHD